MKVLVACEYSGRVRDAFLARGHDAMSCDFLDTESPGPHYKGNVLDILDDGWDMMIAHPECTYVCGSGWHRSVRDPERMRKSTEAVEFFKLLLNCSISKKCIENPVGILSSLVRKPDQYIQPYEFGHDASKKTCLWLENLPKLQPTIYVEPRIVNGKKRWANQTDSGQNKLGPSEDRWKIRSLTYQGWADAMAQQWG